MKFEVASFNTFEVMPETKFRDSSIPPKLRKPRKTAFENILGKGVNKCWLPAFTPFPKMFQTHFIRKVNFGITFILSTGNTFKLD